MREKEEEKGDQIAGFSCFSGATGQESPEPEHIHSIFAGELDNERNLLEPGAYRRHGAGRAPWHPPAISPAPRHL